MKLSIKSGARIQGKVRVDSFRAGFCAAIEPVDRAIRLYKRLLEREGDRRLHDAVMERIERLKGQREAIKGAFFLRTAAANNNLVMDSAGYGLDILIQRLVGTTTYSGTISHIEIGTGSTTPAASDTGLTTGVARAAVSFSEDYGNTDAICQAYIPDANLTNDTYNEMGAFIDGTSTLGSGQIFNHALISPAFTKTSGQDTTLEVDINIVNS